MDFIAYQSTSRVRTYLALFCLTFFSILVILSTHSDSGSATFVHPHSRREVVYVVRQAPSPSPTTPPGRGQQKAPLAAAAAPAEGSGSASSSTSPTKSGTSASGSQTSTPTPNPSGNSTSSIVSSTTSTTSTLSTSSTSSATSTSTTASTTTTRPAVTTPVAKAIAGPATTFSIPIDVLPSTSIEAPEPSDTTATTPLGASSANGFWKNKGGVAATFIFTSLFLLAVVAAIVITFLKRRNARKERALHEEIFPSYHDGDARTASPGPSINDTPMDPFARREVVYDSAPAMSQIPTAPKSSSSCSSDPSTYSNHRIQISAPVQHPDYYNPTRYAPPSQLQAASSTAVPYADYLSPLPPPAVQSKHDSTQSGYQPSVDSFYGAGSKHNSFR